MFKLLVAVVAAGLALWVGWHEGGYANRHTHHGPAAYISALGFAVALLGALIAYDYWKRWQREKREWAASQRNYKLVRYKTEIEKREGRPLTEEELLHLEMNLSNLPDSPS